jgi:hypothetical protein
MVVVNSPATFALIIVAGVPALLAEPVAPPTSSVPVVNILRIREVNFDNWIAADGIFRINWPCLKVTLRSNQDVKSGEVVGRAYFFDKDKKLISKFSTIPKANHPDGSYGLPPLLKARTNIEVYVPIETVAKEAKWRTAILVFGNSAKLAVEEYPRRETMAWKTYDFPEKEAFVSQLRKEEEAKKSRTSLPARPGKSP